MKSYHFDFGNSNTGPIGFCARIAAESPEEAAEKLADILDSINNQNEIALYDRDYQDEYVEVYFNGEWDAAKWQEGIDDEDEYDEEETA